jgi:hypothetical protein
MRCMKTVFFVITNGFRGAVGAGAAAAGLGLARRRAARAAGGTAAAVVAVAGAVEGVSAGVSVAGIMRSMIPNRKHSGKHGGGGATGQNKIPCVRRHAPASATRSSANRRSPGREAVLETQANASHAESGRAPDRAGGRVCQGSPPRGGCGGVQIRWLRAPISTTVPLARHVSGAGYTPFISRASAALLIAADCVVAGDATLAESGPFCCHAMRLLGLPMLSLAPAPLGVGLATGAVRLGRTASACRRSPEPLERPRSRDLRAAKWGVLDTLKNRSTGRFWRS